MIVIADVIVVVDVIVDVDVIVIVYDYAWPVRLLQLPGDAVRQIMLCDERGQFFHRAVN